VDDIAHSAQRLAAVVVLANIFLVVILHHGCAGAGAGACVGCARGAQCSFATAYM